MSIAGPGRSVTTTTMTLGVTRHAASTRWQLLTRSLEQGKRLINWRLGSIDVSSMLIAGGRSMAASRVVLPVQVPMMGNAEVRLEELELSTVGAVPGLIHNLSRGQIRWSNSPNPASSSPWGTCTAGIGPDPSELSTKLASSRDGNATNRADNKKKKTQRSLRQQRQPQPHAWVLLSSPVPKLKLLRGAETTSPHLRRHDSQCGMIISDWRPRLGHLIASWRFFGYLARPLSTYTISIVDYIRHSRIVTQDQQQQLEIDISREAMGILPAQEVSHLDAASSRTGTGVLRYRYLTGPRLASSEPCLTHPGTHHSLQDARVADLYNLSAG
ncbi:hypothetical protein MAPG_06827 [Magnaporthiopsis poae ATCC 64411]|uniref:Uncharacterized protein n=1 Tax=Magnaporthiopsis poae (strain ATCC 64411 / 73-15) TaxID=644358 RepID=A0A0C4E335_MAGP6|nr:hypothetical protein MAPG_06827 [Magnaporthiopsis poae ATCC 64411]